MTSAEIRCRCGEVQGNVADVRRSRVNRTVCYCDDCQAIAHHLGRADLLDAHGGSDIVQVAPASLSFTRGGEHIVGIRLAPNGLYRWTADCCKTPVGNTLGPSVPFVGIHARDFDAEALAAIGPPRGDILRKYAPHGPPPPARGSTIGMVLHAARLIIGWKWSGTWPHPFFDDKTRQPLRPLRVLSKADRDALRPLCGPS